jgi:hypothetical protein
MNAPNDVTPANLLERAKVAADARAVNDAHHVAPPATDNRKPLTPEQVEYFKPKPVQVTDSYAKHFAYEIGIPKMAYIVQRLIDLETMVANQQTTIDAQAEGLAELRAQLLGTD